VTDSENKITISPGDLTDEDTRNIIRLANIVYFRGQAYEHATWMGVTAAKCPTDMWAYQEIIYELEPDLIVETGTLRGGSTLFFAHMLDLIGNGKILSIDIEADDERPQHNRIEYFTGSSIAPDTLDHVASSCESADSVMVILDSDHKAPYKYQEMQAYREFVTPGNYMIAEDSCFDFYPAWPEFGPGPAAAIKRFMESTTDFEQVRHHEKHLLTFAPIAFLRKKVV